MIKQVKTNSVPLLGVIFTTILFLLTNNCENPVEPDGLDTWSFAGADTTIGINEQLEFYGEVSDSLANIVKYEWDFDGDGVYDWNASSNTTANYTYDELGEYEAVFRVTDADNFSDADTRMVTASVWSYKNNLPASGQVCVVENSMYLFGSKVYKYNSINDNWEIHSDTGHSNLSKCVEYAGKAYFFNMTWRFSGQYQTSFFHQFYDSQAIEYDPENDIWIEYDIQEVEIPQSLCTNMINENHIKVSKAENIISIFVLYGGYGLNCGEGESSRFNYLPSSNVWQFREVLSPPRAGAIVSGLSDQDDWNLNHQYVYIFGGLRTPSMNSGTWYALNTAQKFNYGTTGYSSLANVPKVITSGAADSFNDGIYIFGGSDFGGETYNSVYYYSPSSNTYTEKTPMLTPLSHYSLQAVNFQNDIYIIYSSSIFRYQPLYDN